MEYIATFYTHLSSLISLKKLQSNNFIASQIPTPRKISSSCGTAVKYTADNDVSDLLDKDFEAVYKIINDDYVLIKQNI